MIKYSFCLVSFVDEEDGLDEAGMTGYSGMTGGLADGMTGYLRIPKSALIPFPRTGRSLGDGGQ